MSIVKICGAILKHTAIICVISVTMLSIIVAVMMFEPFGISPVILYFIGTILGYIGGGYILITLEYLGVICTG